MKKHKEYYIKHLSTNYGAYNSEYAAYVNGKLIYQDSSYDKVEKKMLKHKRKHNVR